MLKDCASPNAPFGATPPLTSPEPKTNVCVEELQRENIELTKQLLASKNELLEAKNELIASKDKLIALHEENKRLAESVSAVVTHTEARRNNPQHATSVRPVTGVPGGGI